MGYLCEQGAAMRGRAALGLLVLLFGLALAGCSGGQGAVPEATPAVAAPLATSAETSLPSATIAPSDTPTASVTPTLSPTPTATPTVTPTPTAQPTDTSTPTPTATSTPGPTPDGKVRVARVPILMYHYISQPPPDADVYRVDLSVPPEHFESQLQYFKEAGYRVITLDDLLYFLADGIPLPEKPIILTFDDGYEDNYVNAFPLLRKYGVAGCFFIISDFVNEKQPDYMTWPQIEEMSAAGQRFGSHSRNHPDLRGKSVDYLVWQALGGMEAIQEHLGYHPRWISYPSGGYDARVIAVYKSANYWGGLATQQGATHMLDGIFELERVRVRGSYTVEELAALLKLDW